jgi:hypothetical protein
MVESERRGLNTYDMCMQISSISVIKTTERKAAM